MNDVKDKLKIWQFFNFKLNLILKFKGNYPPKTIGILTKVFCSCGPNLVILAWMRDKLSRRQASGYSTHRHTDRQTQPTTIPEGQNWPRVKTFFYFVLIMQIRIFFLGYLGTWNLLSLFAPVIAHQSIIFSFSTTGHSVPHMLTLEVLHVFTRFRWPS